MRTTLFEDDSNIPRKNAASVAVTRGTSRKVRASSPAVADGVAAAASTTTARATTGATKRRRKPGTKRGLWERLAECVSTRQR